MEYSNITNIPDNYSHDSNLTEPSFSWWACYQHVILLVACVGFPLILLAIYTLYKEVQEDHVAPVYLINLLVSDLLQMCSSNIISLGYRHINLLMGQTMYFIGLSASVGFMVCIAVERYLLVAFPLWYRCRRNIRNSVIVSLLVWALCVIIFILPVVMFPDMVLIIFTVLLILPFPVLIFSLVGTLKGLVASVAVSRKEKLRIVTVLVLVLLNYMVLFLPFIIWVVMAVQEEETHSHFMVSLILFQLSPLVDLLLYVFMRRGAFTKLQLNLRCCKKTSANELRTTNAGNMAAEEEGEEGEGPHRPSA